MSGLRGFVTGADGCSGGTDGAGPSNAVAGLANMLMGSGKAQQTLSDLPRFAGPAGPSGQIAGPSAAPLEPMPAAEAAAAAVAGPSHAAPLSAMNAPHGAAAREGWGVDEFLEYERTMAPAQHAGLHADMEAAFAQARPGPGAPDPMRLAPLHGVIGDFLRHAAQAGPHAPPPALPRFGLSPAEQCKLRDRATILARHLCAGRGDAHAADVAADAAVAGLLACLSIDPQALQAQLPHAHDAAWHGVFDSAGAEHAAGARAAAGGDWASEFSERLSFRELPPGATSAPGTSTSARWAEEMAAAPGEGWAAEFQKDRGTVAEGWAAEHAKQAARVGSEEGLAQQSGVLANALASSGDPKMQGSKFLQFLSKMSHGELRVEDDKLVEVPKQANDWAAEFAAPGPVGDTAAWAAEFAAPGPVGDAAAWAADFADREAAGGTSHADVTAWADAFADGLGTGLEAAAGEWADSFAEQFGATQGGETARTGANGEYIFVENNPFSGDADALSKGRALFAKGLLSEAALALEAALQAGQGGAEAWRLLGTAHTENDDDERAIAAMRKAVALDPENLDILLSLGVSHTNELDEKQALGYMHAWLERHPQHGAVAKRWGAAPDTSQAHSHLLSVVDDAIKAQSRDPDLHTVRGVLCHLAGDYSGAASAFGAALEAAPADYGLWNKLGATLANAGRSGEALGAYQKALAAKPNYVRGWANLGIARANLGEYATAAALYVRALSLNSNAHAVWGYLSTALACSGRADLFSAAESRDLATLAAALPLPPQG